MFQPELGVSLHCLVDEITDEALQAVGDSRIATLEIWPGLFGEKQAAARKESLKATCRVGSVSVASIHVPFGPGHDFSRLDPEGHERGMATLSASIDLAVELDAPILVAHADAEPAGAPRRGERLERGREAFRRITRRCKEARKRIAVELLPRTCLGNTVEEILEILDGLDEDVFGVCVDVNHFMDRYAQLGRDIRTLGRRLVTTHLSDYDGIDEKHWMPGKGVIDWASVMAALRDIEYAGPFNYECRPPGDTLREKTEALQRNFDWLRAL